MPKSLCKTVEPSTPKHYDYNKQANGGQCDCHIKTGGDILLLLAVLPVVQQRACDYDLPIDNRRMLSFHLARLLKLGRGDDMTAN